MKQFRDTQYYVFPDGRILSKYPVGGDNRYKKGKPSSNKERFISAKCAYRSVGTKGGEKYKIHQMVMECYGPPKPEGPAKPEPGYYVIDHINEDPTDNRIENLQWLTNEENIAKGNKSRKMTDELEDKIFDEYVPRKVTRKMLAEKYGCSEALIKAIISRKGTDGRMKTPPSGYKNVYYKKSRNSYFGQFRANGKLYNTKYYTRPEEANRAVIALRNSL